MMRRRAATLAGAALVLASIPAAAQSAADGPSPFAGRWAVTLEGGAPPRVRGELRLRDSSGVLVGTLLLATHDSAPVHLRDVHADGIRIEFLAPLEPGMRLVGRLGAGGITGDALGGAGEQLQTWTASRLSDAIEFYPTLPRFTLRQLIAGRPDSAVRVPGAWVAAAAADGHVVDSLFPAYRRASAAAGLAPLPAAALLPDGGPYLLGVYRRDETSAALQRALGSIHDDLATPALQARFQRIFAARSGGWLADAHAVALDRARRRSPTIDWADAGPALAAAGWLPSDASAEAGTLPYAVYRLAHLATTDTARYRLLKERMGSAAASARAVELLLDGYRDALEWYPQALEFLLEAEWVRAGAAAPPRSIAALMGDLWGDRPAVPALRAAYFGYPQAVPRYGTSDALLARIVVAENWPAREWLERNGRTRLLTVMQRLGVDSLVPTAVEHDGRTYRLTTVRRQARESINGFLEPADVIVADPGVPPLFALGTVVHEWQHLVHERARWAAPDTAQPLRVNARTAAVTLRPVEPVVAEGLAEWAAEVVLAPVVARYPIVGVAEPLKRARLGVGTPDDPHVIGYLLARTLAGLLAPGATADLLVAASLDASVVTRDRAVSRAWARQSRTADLTLHRRPALVLVPETVFTIEGGWPDPVAGRLRF